MFRFTMCLVSTLLSSILKICLLIHKPDGPSNFLVTPEIPLTEETGDAYTVWENWLPKFYDQVVLDRQLVPPPRSDVKQKRVQTTTFVVSKGRARTDRRR